MKKNNYSRTLLTVAVTLLGTWVLSSGCDDFLKEKNIPQLTVDFYETTEGIENAVIAAYSYLRHGLGGEFSSVLNEYGTDLVAGAAKQGAATNTYIDISESAGAFSGIWNNHYKGINTANLVKDGIQMNETMTEEQKNAALAEVYFLRAYFYFDLVQQFGKIPLVTEADYEVRTSFTRAPVSDVYNFIVTDLRFAVEHLRESVSASDKNIGKATRYAAAHLLSKVYLARCSAVTEQRGQKGTDADSALYYAEQVINSGKYRLLRNYSDVFDPNNEMHSEVVFAVQFTTDLIYNGNGNQHHMYWLAPYDGMPGMQRSIELGRPWAHMRVTNKVMLELFDRKNDSRFYKSFTWAYLANLPNAPIPLGDTTIYYSLNPSDRQTAYTRFVWNREDETKNNTYYPSLNKWDDPNRATINEQKGSRDWMRMRFGETYLLAAEAAGRKGDFEKAAEYINVIRERAAWQDGEEKMPQYWVEEGGERGNTDSTYEQIKVTAADVQQPTFVDFILDERGRELLGEYFRWEDLVRCEKLVEYVKKWSVDGRNNIQDYHKLRPIPETHRKRILPPNPKEEDQNPGYAMRD